LKHLKSRLRKFFSKPPVIFMLDSAHHYHRWVDWFDWSIHSFVCSFTNSLTHSFIHSFYGF